MSASHTNDSAKQIEKNTEVQQELGVGNGVSGEGGISVNYTRGQASGGSETVTFTRTYIHFLDDGNSSDRCAVETDENGFVCWNLRLRYY